jgi:chloride channel 3/4/5
MAPPTAPPLERTHSTSSVPASIATEVPSGPLSGPSDTTWRRQRLLHIGSVQSLSSEQDPQGQGMTESTPIAHSRPPMKKSHSLYGTVPSAVKPKGPGFRMRHGLPALPVLRLPSSRVPSVSNSPTQRYGTLDRTFIFRSQRPISAYDAPALVGHHPEGVADLDAEGVVRANGIRVWYSSFSSIDWLHDAIKDSTRMYRLRRHKSLRGRMRSASDRFIGWIIVTIVGFLTAIAAFLVVRSEQWLFDIKYGYCVSGWWKARRFCCLDISDARTFALGASMETPCGAWVPWGDALTNTGASQLSRTLVGRASYSLLAVRITCFLFLRVKTR